MANREKPRRRKVEATPVVTKTLSREDLGYANELLEDRPVSIHDYHFNSGSLDFPGKSMPRLEEGKVRTLEGTADGKAFNLYLSREDRIAYRENNHEVKWYEAVQNDANLLCILMLEGMVDIAGIPRESQRFRRLQYVLTSIASMKSGNLRTDKEWVKMLKELRAEGYSYDEISNRKGALNILIAFQRAISGIRKKGVDIEDFIGNNPKYKEIRLRIYPQVGKKYRALYVIDEETEKMRVAGQ
ncbi:hypothetical protein GF366_02705 [Candidatus Peregrinibacteria bacterium]|nr:hypothetical protein [Candidatus Peregrinibacteria bacterium]